jgi:hypothetical protein
MPNTVATGVAEPATSVETKPMSDSDFLSRRIAKLKGPDPTPPAEEKPAELKSEPDAKPADAAPSTEGGQQTPAEPKADVLSKDISELTDDEIAELAQKGKSGLLKRIAELTAKRKLAEEKAAILEAREALRLQQQQQQPPEPRVENNPYTDVGSIEALQAKQAEVESAIEWYEDTLYKNEDAAANDIVATVQGKEVSKAELREALRNAKKARDRYLPAQYRELQARGLRAQQEDAFRQQARKELSWLNGEDNDTRKQFEAMVKDPRIGKLKVAVPDLAPQIEYLVAHAANSMFTRREIEALPSNPTKPTLTPPATPKSSAAPPERADARVEKAIKDVQSRFQETGSSNDYVALRAAQISKRISK